MERKCRRLYICIVVLIPFITPVLRAQSPGEIAVLYKFVREGKADTATVKKLLTAGNYYLDKAGSYAADITQTLALAAAAEKVSSQLHYLPGEADSKLLLSKGWDAMHRPDKARPFAEQAMVLFDGLGMLKRKADAMVALANTHGNEGDDMITRQNLFKQAIAVFHQLGDRLSEAKLKEFLGDLYNVSGEYNNAIQQVNEALQLYRAERYVRLVGAYCILGYSYNSLGDFVQSLKYNLLAVKTGELLHDSAAMMSMVYNRLGLIYYSINYNRQALDYFKRGLQLSRAVADTLAMQNILTNIAATLNKTGAYQQAYDSLQQSGQLLPLTDKNDIAHQTILFMKICDGLGRGQAFYLNKLLSIYQHNEASPDMMQLIRLSLANQYQQAGDFTKAAPFLAAFTDAQQSGVWIPLVKAANAEYLLFRSDSAAGRSGPALKHFLLYKSISDSLTGKDQAKLTGELQLRFETEGKDKDIELLTQKSRLQQASLQKEKMIRYVIVAGIIVLLLFSMLMYSRYLLKKRTNIELEAQRAAIHDQNGKLQRLLDDKEWLLKEIHHRVKNNLQIMISLLNTQSQYLENKDALAAIRNSQHRMYAMSLIHQRLYQSEGAGVISMNWYIRELTEYMKDCFETGRRIRIEPDCDALELDVVQAVSVGLIINEAVNNAIKYAFPANATGCIHISCKQTSGGICVFSVTDNGIGMSKQEAFEEGDSLGMSLMHGLSGQLEGEFMLTTEAGKGVKVEIAFPVRQIVAAGA